MSIKIASNVVINTKGSYYSYMYYGQEKRVSFDYAFNKAFNIINELNMFGLALPVPLIGHKGRIEGWADYLLAGEEAETYCKTWGVELECLLTRELIGFEGCKVKIEWDNGKSEICYIERFGKYAPYHIKRRKAGHKAGGKRVTDKVITLQVLEERTS